MKILYVQDTDWIRRNPTHHNHLAERLALRGHEIRVVDYELLWRTNKHKELLSHRQVFKVARLLKDANHTVVRPGILKVPILDYVSMLFTYRKEINRQIQEFGPDVIIGDCILTPFLAFKAAKRHCVPTVYYILDVSHKLIPFKILQPVGRLIERHNFHKADRVLCINQALKEYCLQMGSSPGTTHVFAAGTDPAKFDLSKNGSDVRECYGIEKDDLVLFFVGWIHHFNGLKEVALEMAKTPKGKIKLLVVGDGDGLRDLQAIRKNYGLEDRVILAGRKPYDEVPSFLAAADICLLPAYPDEPIMQNIVPLKMYDYLTAAKPVISTRLHGIIKEFGEHNGVVYVDRPEDVVQKAIELVQNESIKDLGAKARNFAESYTWDKVTDEFEDLLDQLVRESKGKKVAALSAYV